MSRNQLRVREDAIEMLALAYDRVEVSADRKTVQVFNRTPVSPGSVYVDRRTHHEGMRLVATFRVVA